LTVFQLRNSGNAIAPPAAAEKEVRLDGPKLARPARPQTRQDEHANFA